ncbi:hypothetical protein ACFFGV_05000 [Pontibacillus salicampi]|uniref:Uncharacterized protein n=1 Tax=Pontibacillus salicampi TaxID=1449801 RepID=A0ABV6LKS4_9BACI
MSTFLLGIALFVNLFYIAITLFGLDTWLGIRVGNYNGELGVLLVVSFIISLYIFFKEKQKHVNSFKIFSLIVITLSVGTFGWFSFLNILGLFMEF